MPCCNINSLKQKKVQRDLSWVVLTWVCFSFLYMLLTILPLIFFPSCCPLPHLCKTQSCVWLWDRMEVKDKIISTGVEDTSPLIHKLFFPLRLHPRASEELKGILLCTGDCFKETRDHHVVYEKGNLPPLSLLTNICWAQHVLGTVPNAVCFWRL